jgi:hypothetical protein
LLFHGHGGLYSEFSGFIATGCYYTTFITATTTGLPFNEGLFLFQPKQKMNPNQNEQYMEWEWSAKFIIKDKYLKAHRAIALIPVFSCDQFF